MVSDKVWATMKIRALGSMAVFMTFGVAGWWTLFTNRRKYSHADWAAMLGIAAQIMKRRANHATSPSTPGLPVISLTPLFGSWNHLNAFLFDIIHKTIVKPVQQNWLQAQFIWQQELTDIKIAQLFMMDVLDELANAHPSRSITGSAAPMVTPGADISDEWAVLKRNIGTVYREESSLLKEDVNLGWKKALTSTLQNMEEEGSDTTEEGSSEEEESEEEEEEEAEEEAEEPEGQEPPSQDLQQQQEEQQQHQEEEQPPETGKGKKRAEQPRPPRRGRGRKRPLLPEENEAQEERRLRRRRGPAGKYIDDAAAEAD